jgi:hypothetical protein
MDANQILTITVFIVVMTIVGTIALAAVGYLAFRLRERRNPRSPGIDETMTRPYFFERVRIPGPPAEPVAVPAAVKGGTPRPALESGTRD